MHGALCMVNYVGQPSDVFQSSFRHEEDGADVSLFCGDSINLYSLWPSPTVIVSDGPYGVSGFPGDLHNPKGLADWYLPHVLEWSKRATPLTTLWFWNTEVGWAIVHPILEAHGWDYVSCCVWDKGLSHVAGNVNTKTIRHLPVVTEVCVQYVKRPAFVDNGSTISMQEWLRKEWQRTGLPLSLTNEACGVKNAATRKYFTKCHLWYMPPAEAFEKIVNYANTHGKKDGVPYFSTDGKTSLSKQQWERLRAKFYCPFGVTNVWREPQLRNSERLKDKNKAIHLNQKPKNLIKRIIEMSSDSGDVIWDPFAGLCSVASVCLENQRRCYCAEIQEEVFAIAKDRLLLEIQERQQCLFQNTIV